MLYWIAQGVVSSLARVFFRFRVINRERIPDEGGVIVAPNHSSYFDIPLLAAALPREANNVAKMELFHNFFVAILLKSLGGFPVRRGMGDRAALNEALKRLAAGRLLVIYPEGTRSRDGQLLPPKSGIGWLVAQSGARVVPAYIRGTNPLRLFRSITITFGEPLDFKKMLQEAEKEEMHPKVLYGRIAHEIMGRIESLKKIGSRL